VSIGKKVGNSNNLTKFANMMRSMLRLPNLCKILFALYMIQGLVSCANIVPPSGGPRDSIPPYRIFARPKDSTTNIQPKEIIIAFNEYIATTNIQENLVVNPGTKNTPLIESKLNTVRIRLNDSLSSNTTYRIQFGNAIRDVNEGNIAQDFSYVFSTGNQIDSGKLQGTVKLAETGRVDSTLIVALQPKDNDTAIFKNKPLYYAKLNGKGKFSFDFLPFKQFNIFVIPNDYNKKYDDSTKYFAFGETPVTVARNQDSIRLYAFQAYPKGEKKRAVNNKQAKRNTPTLKYLRNLDGKEQDLLHPLQFVFESPVQLNDSFPIILTDTFNKPVSNFIVKIDSANANTVSIEYPWIANTPFHLIVPQNAIKDSLNNILSKADTLSFITKSNTYYGSCLIRINGYESFKNPILLLTQDDKVKFKFNILQNLLNIAQLPPGEFQLKVLEDENNNGRWDTGKYGFGNVPKQPEKVWILPYKLNVRADWENELNITINK
jgi:hypothetical protein